MILIKPLKAVLNNFEVNFNERSYKQYLSKRLFQLLICFWRGISLSKA